MPRLRKAPRFWEPDRKHDQLFCDQRAYLNECRWRSGYRGCSVYWFSSAANKLVAHSTSNVLTLGQWSHIAVVYDATLAQASRFTIYVNGVDVTDRTDISSAGTIASPTRPIPGWVAMPLCQYLSGAIDDIRFYARKLAQTEVVTDMNTGLSVDPTPPTVSMTAPAAGTVTGTVTVSANASDKCRRSRSSVSARWRSPGR